MDLSSQNHSAMNNFLYEFSFHRLIFVSLLFSVTGQKLHAQNCNAKVSSTETRVFMCHNLGAANTGANPLTPGWEINGGYWQWGRLAQAAAGPTGSGSSQSNSGNVGGWNTTHADNGSWTDNSKTSNDPCPAGFRIPTKTQWDGVVANNTITYTGTNWSSGATNYSTGIRLGDNLFLPAAGTRNGITGALFDRGLTGFYWSSTELGSVNAWDLRFNNGSVSTQSNFRRADGFSVRCIAESAITGSTGALNCPGSSVTGTLTVGQPATGVSASVPYTSGNGGAHSGQTVASTGVTGLTATLSAGTFANGSGALTYNITGTPSAAGVASFALSIGGQSCTLAVTVASAVCSAKVSVSEVREFMCHNLGAANTSADPFTPGWEINGGYWQWGRPAQAAAGPAGAGSGQANDGAVSGWNTANAANGDWSDNSKTANDPCPAGFRVPTKTQWDGIKANNTLTNLGTWTSSPTNYSSGKKVGTALMLPAAGVRLGDNNGTLYLRGLFGGYWTSTESGSSNAWGMYFESGYFNPSTNYVRTFGLSVRCMSETPITGSVATLNCAGATVTGTLTSGQAATGVTASVPYTGGNGGGHNGQTVTSTGVTGLTAALSAGNFANGSGSLTYNITGTPSSTGTANFALDIGGKTCTLSVSVASVQCSAKVSATETRVFMCHNLGAANTGANPLTPGWEINGGYWQWGRPAQAAAGPTGPGSGEANIGIISGWNTTAEPNGAWTDASKTANDPCPSGFRVPTKAQWDGVVTNNTRSNVGTFFNNATNYSSGVKFGNNLMLPTAGRRYYLNSSFDFRGNVGFYWSTTENGSTESWFLLINGDGAYVFNSGIRADGFSVRCIAESAVTGSTGALNCAGNSVTGTLTVGQPATGVSASVPYTGGNGGAHSGQTVASTGVTGLTATLSAGTFANGSGALTYNITGTPSAAGVASFALSIGGQSCTLAVTSEPPITGSVAALNCAGATVTGTLSSGQAATGVTASVPYTGGNGGVHNGQTVTSTGVSGLTAALSASTFASGSGSLNYVITGTPATSGTANFELNIGGQTCTLSVQIASARCFAKISATETRVFMCHNLGAANTGADPFTPGWEINGGYWQWGRLSQAAAGPTGPGAGQANEVAVTGWNTSNAPAGSWSDNTRTSSDPCPAGFRVPTRTHWEGVISNNSQTGTGTWSSGFTNYSSGKMFGNNLFFPAAGYRNISNGALAGRGNSSYYWSSTENGAFVISLSVGLNQSSVFNDNHTYGNSIRCIAESPVIGSIGALNCSGTTVSGTLIAGQAASGISASVPYTGGNEGAHNGQTISSTGVTGLTATLTAGTFANGSGALTYNITGIPSAAGVANFALNIGGRGCTLSAVAVQLPVISTVENSGYTNNDGVICAGATVTLNAVNGTSFVWSNGSGTSSTVVSPTSTTTYTVTATDSFGSTTTASATITVNSVPAPGLSIAETSGAAVNDGEICSGANVTLTASGGGTYLWNTASSAASITVSPVSTTTYTVLVTSVNGCSATAVGTIAVTQQQVPTVAVFELSGAANNDAVICEGASASLTASGGSSYLWSNGASTASIDVSPTATATYTVTATNNNGCTATNTRTITVTPQAIPSVAVSEVSGVSDNDAIICEGASASLTVSGGVSYIWSNGATTASISVTPAATATYTVTATNANGCTATNTRTIVVNPIPSTMVTVEEMSGSAVNDGIICAGASVLLTASGGISFLWTNGVSGTSLTVSPTATATYTVTATDANGCNATTSQTITVNPLPNPSVVVAETSGLVSNDAVICMGSSALLTASGGVSYLWNNGSNTSSNTVSPSVTTTYTVTLTNVNGCTASTTRTITVIPPPTPTITVAETSAAANNDGVICVGDGATLTAADGISYVWNTGAASTSISVSPAVTTTYTVTVTNSNLCTATATTTVTVLADATITSFSPASGQPGTIVTINGAAMGCLQSVTIGGVPQIILGKTNNSATIFVMPGTPSGPISVTANNNSLAVSSTAFTVTATPHPYIQQGGKTAGGSSSGSPQQGTSVAVSADGNTVAIGGPTDDSNKGAVWIFVRNGTTWSQQGGKLTGSGAVGTARQGTSVAISADGNTVAIGGPTDNSSAGAVWIFTRTNGMWSQQGNKLTGTGASGNAQQGAAISLSATGNIMAVGGPADNSYSGAAWVFARNGDTWAQEGSKLTGTGKVGQARQGVSVAVSSDGTTLITGGNNDMNRRGAAWVFVRGSGTWNQQGTKLVGTGASSDSWQGISVAVSANGNTALIGGSSDNSLKGAAWVFTRSSGMWSQQGSKLVGTGATGAARQGSSVGLSADGNTAVIGGFGDNSNRGAMWVYKRNGTTWAQQGAKINGSGASGSAKQGTAASLSSNGTTVAIGGPADASNKGAFWFFVPNSALADTKTDVRTEEEQSAADHKVVLYQNVPNPLTDRTSVRFTIPEACTATWQITDIKGRTILELKRNYPAGDNTEVFDLSGYQGVFWYTLRTPFGNKTRQMLIIK